MTKGKVLNAAQVKTGAVTKGGGGNPVIRASARAGAAIMRKARFAGAVPAARKTGGSVKNHALVAGA